HAEVSHGLQACALDIVVSSLAIGRLVGLRRERLATRSCASNISIADARIECNHIPTLATALNPG
ncbi:hypothetical protein, partial [Mesorhizobium sp.]|uniref:hypothetical protein n=1 Tax=Mesorhizobium sp. TaxID=1871066 RepID=UPI0025E1FBDA